MDLKIKDAEIQNEQNVEENKPNTTNCVKPTMLRQNSCAGYIWNIARITQI